MREWLSQAAHSEADDGSKSSPDQQKADVHEGFAPVREGQLQVFDHVVNHGLDSTNLGMGCKGYSPEKIA